LDGGGIRQSRTIAVTHASIIRAAVIHAIDAMPRSFRRIDIAPLSLTALRRNNGRWSLGSVGAIEAE
jgi:broad specificity phosphatase PhoE